MTHSHLSLISQTGDPGLFDTLRRIGRGVVGGVGGFFSGGPVGAVTGTIGGIVRGGGRPTPGQLLLTAGGAAGGIARAPLTIPQIPVRGIAGAIQRAIPGGRTGFEASMGMGLACPRGFHPNKSTYMTQGGMVMKGTKCVRNRSRNFANGRALRRSIGRVKGFERLVKSSRKSLKALARI